MNNVPERLTYWANKSKGFALPVQINDDGDCVDHETLCEKLARYEDISLKPDDLAKRKHDRHYQEAEMMDSFKEAAAPLVMWLQKNGCPMDMVLVSFTSAELYSGEIGAKYPCPD